MKLFLIFNLLFFKIVSSQNLIPNGGFENYNCIPHDVNEMNCCKHWYSPINSSDYFYRSFDIKSEVNIPSNYCGDKDAHSGDGYVGFSCYHKDNGFQEYIQVKLSDSLIKGKYYNLKFYLSLAKKSYFKPHNIVSFLFTDSNLVSYPNSDLMIYRNKKGRKMLDASSNIKVHFDSLVIKDSIHNWVKIEHNYLAEGGEKILTIGVFKNDISWFKNFLIKFIKKKEKRNNQFGGNYYYIDDVSLTMVKVR